MRKAKISKVGNTTTLQYKNGTVVKICVMKPRVNKRLGDSIQKWEIMEWFIDNDARYQELYDLTTVAYKEWVECHFLPCEKTARLKLEQARATKKEYVAKQWKVVEKILLEQSK